MLTLLRPQGTWKVSACSVFAGVRATAWVTSSCCGPCLSASHAQTTTPAGPQQEWETVAASCVGVLTTEHLDIVLAKHWHKSFFQISLNLGSFLLSLSCDCSHAPLKSRVLLFVPSFHLHLLIEPASAFPGHGGVNSSDPVLATLSPLWDAHSSPQELGDPWCPLPVLSLFAESLP